MEFWLFLRRIISLIVIFVKPFEDRQNLNLNQNLSQQNSVSPQNCLADDCLLVDNLDYPVSELPQSVKDALDEAINDEYKALATYEAVISKFGTVRPFSMIKGAEEQHIALLKAVYDKYGLQVPQNTWSSKVSSPETIQEACQTGVDAEIANAALYKEKLLPVVADYEDITAVFINLMNASEQKHLPSFDKCN
jgi:hypothetical protein